MIQADDILTFWRGLGPAGWYAVDAAIDDAIRHRFGPAWRKARNGGFRGWRATPEGALAYLILTDQFPRNMFRGSPEAFATDARALSAARRAVLAELDLQVAVPERQFFYMPFMHSEKLADQDSSIALFRERMPDPGSLRHAIAHHEVIRRFKRFPYRNAALGRVTRPAERRFLDDGGYAAILRDLGE